MADTKVSALAELSVPDFSDDLYIVNDTGPTSNKVGTDRFLGLLLSTVEGRLTVETGVPVSTTDQLAKGTLYYTPYIGNRISLYDGTRWRMYSFAEVSLALTLTSGKNYDVFLYDNAGTLTLELSSAWTNDTTRADALATQDTITVKSGATTRRWLGTIRASASNQTADSGGLTGTTQVGGTRFVWNAYNRVRRPIMVKTTTASWTYSTADYRQVEAASGNRVEVVVGQECCLLDLTARALSNDSGGTATMDIATAIGEDSTTAPHARCYGMQGGITVANLMGWCSAHLSITIPLGYHAYNWLEWSEASGTQTWFGEGASGGDTVRRTGLIGWSES